MEKNLLNALLLFFIKSFINLSTVLLFKLDISLSVYIVHGQSDCCLCDLLCTEKKTQKIVIYIKSNKMLSMAIC